MFTSGLVGKNNVATIKFLVLLHHCLLIYTDVVPLTRATHGQGSGMIVEEISCNGAESRLIDCSVRDQRDGECSHREDAGVICGKVAWCT